MKHKFAHRSHLDGTVDAICRHCFQTIATVRDEAKLSQFEQEHACEPAALARFEYWKLFYREVEELKES